MKSIIKNGIYSDTIKGSRFLGYGKPVESIEAAKAFIKEISELHRTATHNVPAFSVLDGGRIDYWASDNGEPQGTAGAPILSTIRESQLTNLVIVVTRYFGGTKLGTGGLIRAYTEIAKKTLEECVICNLVKKTALELQTDYNSYNSLKRLAESLNAKIIEPDYKDDVTVKIAMKDDVVEKFIKGAENLTSGRIIVNSSKKFLDRDMIKK